MRAFGFIIKGISALLYWISCAAVACIVCLTVFDVIMRRAGHPVDFAVEIVILLAGIVIACAFPATSSKGRTGSTVPFLEDVLKHDYQTGWKRLLEKLEEFFDDQFENDWKEKLRIKSW